MSELDDLEMALQELEEHMSPMFTRRRELREKIAELRPPAQLPPARYRTAKQDAIARCPRCGNRLEEKPAAPPGDPTQKKGAP